MWATAFAIFFIAKLLSFWPARQIKATPAKIISYFLAWPGLDAAAFLAPARQPEKVIASEWSIAALKMGFGLALLFTATRFSGSVDPYLTGWIGMLGVVFTLHFGLFHLLSCFWRSQGVNAPPLMDWPILSKSVSEFWGKRWNRAFRDLTHRFVFRPLTSRFGLAMGSLLAFLFSGLIHELVITLPAGGGYGGPTIYFVIQGVGLLVERSKTARRLGLGTGWPSRLFTAAILVAPVGLLFPQPFVVDIVAPFLEALRKLC